MDVACRMELRHEEGVHVPELGFHERAPHFLKSHAHEFGLDGIEELAIGMPFARSNARRAETDRVLTETLRPPAPVFQQFGRELGDFRCSPLPGELLGGFYAGIGQLERSGHSIVDTKGFPRVPPLDGVVLNDLLLCRGKCLQISRRSTELLQQSPHRFRRLARPAGRFDTAALNDQERALFLEASDRTAHILRFKSFPGLNVLNGQTLACFSRIASSRQHPLDRRVLFKVEFADFGERDIRRDGLGIDGE
jgi:hypothetical protein